jgi:hypothetical protein
MIGFIDRNGIAHIDHKNYPEHLKTVPWESLYYIAANPNSSKAGYYADEINYCMSEIERRKKG